MKLNYIELFIEYIENRYNEEPLKYDTDEYIRLVDSMRFIHGIYDNEFYEWFNTDGYSSYAEQTEHKIKEIPQQTLLNRLKEYQAQITQAIENKAEYKAEYKATITIKDRDGSKYQISSIEYNKKALNDISLCITTVKNGYDYYEQQKYNFERVSMAVDPLTQSLTIDHAQYGNIEKRKKGYTSFQLSFSLDDNAEILNLNASTNMLLGLIYESTKDHDFTKPCSIPLRLLAKEKYHVDVISHVTDNQMKSVKNMLKELEKPLTLKNVVLNNTNYSTLENVKLLNYYIGNKNSDQVIILKDKPLINNLINISGLNWLKSFKNEYLNIPTLSNTEKNMLLTDYLMTLVKIHSNFKDRSNGINYISFDRIYNELHAESKDDKKRIRQNTSKVLDRFKELHIIHDYEYIKDGRMFKSIKLIYCAVIQQ